MFSLHDAERLALHHEHQLVARRWRAWKQELEEVFEEDAVDEVVNVKKASS